MRKYDFPPDLGPLRNDGIRNQLRWRRRRDLRHLHSEDPLSSPAKPKFAQRWSTAATGTCTAKGPCGKIYEYVVTEITYKDVYSGRDDEEFGKARSNQDQAGPENIAPYPFHTHQ